MANKSEQINLTKQKGFWAAFMLGGIISIFLFIFVVPTHPIIYVILSIPLLVIIWASAKSIKKDSKDGQYLLFVGTVATTLGFIWGGIALLLAQRYRWVFDYLAAILAVIFIGIGAVGFAVGYLSPYTVYSLGPTINVTTTQASLLCGNDTSLVRQLFSIPSNQTVVSTYCNGVNMYAKVLK